MVANLTNHYDFHAEIHRARRSTAACRKATAVMRRTRPPQPSFGGTYRRGDAAPAHPLAAGPPAVHAAFRFSLSFENNDLTHAPLSVEASSLLSEGGCACMSSTLTVRRIVADQGGVYRELRAASLREPYAPGEAPEAELLNVETDAASAIAAQRAVSDESTTFLLYTEGHPAGMIGAYFDNTPDRRAFVSELWVAHAVRHLRGGVLLLETATAWLAERGAQDVYAWIADANRNAIRFYERAGFGNTGEHAPIARMPGAMKSLYVSQMKH
ncbi:GNAT family N-acetyltransferase [Burkholderia lata]